MPDICQMSYGTTRTCLIVLIIIFTSFSVSSLVIKLTKTFLLHTQNYLTLLDDEDHRLEYLKIQDEQHLVIEGTRWKLHLY